jgi:large subunit ribosomal protein L10
MDKAQKAEVVKEITARLEESEAIFAIDYRGISVPQAAELRGALRDADASFSIVKNRLAKRAAEDAGREGLDEMLEGPTALTYVRGDVVTAAKAISNFNREHETLTYKGGFMDGDALDEDRFNSLARLPALDVMHGQLVGMTAAPLTGLVRGLGSMLSGLAVALGQIQEQGLVGGDAPAEEEGAGSDPSGSGEDAEASETDNDEEGGDDADASEESSEEA